VTHHQSRRASDDDGDAGIDLVFDGGSTKVTVGLSLATDNATRGSETDTLYNVEGAIGSSAAAMRSTVAR
jgi:hypothetical protein